MPVYLIDKETHSSNRLNNILSTMRSQDSQLIHEVLKRGQGVTVFTKRVIGLVGSSSLTVLFHNAPHLFSGFLHVLSILSPPEEHPYPNTIQG